MQLRIISLGGTANVTKNMYVYELLNQGVISDILLVDCGVGFHSQLVNLGVDFVIPDISYLQNKLDKIRGLVISHGHDDHIGAIPFILPKLNFPPVFAPKLASLLIKEKLEEEKLTQARITSINFQTDYNLGAFKVRFIRMTHSIPDTSHIFIQTPVGNVYHGSDFKFDLTPVYSEAPDFAEISRASGMKVKLLLSDALGSEREGYTASEKIVGKTFFEEMGNSKGRFLMTTFASNISRIQQCIDAATSYGRKICFVGRTMKRNSEIGMAENYLHLNKEQIIEDTDLKQIPGNKVCIILTGSQGEYGSALEKIASGRHRFIKLQKTDRILFSSDPIPGNETYVQELLENIIEQGAEVIYTAIRDQLHSSGHGSQEDLKLLARLVKPEYLMPIGTTIKHSRAYVKLMKTLGYREENILVLHAGEPLLINDQGRVSVESLIPLKEVLVDGSSIGDVGATILKERENLGKEGVLVVNINKDKIELISRGFIFYEKNLFRELEELVKSVIKKNQKSDNLENELKNELGGFIDTKIQRNPEIIIVASSPSI